MTPFRRFLRSDFALMTRAARDIEAMCLAAGDSPLADTTKKAREKSDEAASGRL